MKKAVIFYFSLPHTPYLIHHQLLSFLLPEYLQILFSDTTTWVCPSMRQLILRAFQWSLQSFTVHLYHPSEGPSDWLRRWNLDCHPTVSLLTWLTVASVGILSVGSNKTSSNRHNRIYPHNWRVGLALKGLDQAIKCYLGAILCHLCLLCPPAPHGAPGSSRLFLLWLQEGSHRVQCHSPIPSQPAEGQWSSHLVSLAVMG